jgi:hypothetical protein
MWIPFARIRLARDDTRLVMAGLVPAMTMM